MRSMTGFGRASLTLEGQPYRLELRSLNHRFLDLRLKLPGSSGELDGRVTATVRKHVSRGRMELSLEPDKGAGGAGSLRLDTRLAEEVAVALFRLARELKADLATAARLLPPQEGLLLRAGPGEAMTPDAIWTALEPALERALEELSAMRRREGAAHREGFLRLAEEVRRAAAKIAELAADEPALHRRRLEQRLAQLTEGGVELDPARLAQEVALLADKSDIAEELDRLGSHLDQLEGMLETDGPVGRKVEFLLQEFHRELNTIGAKTQRVEISHLAVEAKSSVEKMRELAQNVE